MLGNKLIKLHKKKENGGFIHVNISGLKNKVETLHI